MAAGVCAAMLSPLILTLLFSSAGGEVAHACYSAPLTLQCAPGSVLVLDRVTYERVTASRCATSWPPSKCSPLQSVAALRRRCHAKTICSLSTDDEALRCGALPWGEDSRLQIQVSYTCVQVRLMHTTTGCLHSPGFPHPYPLDATCTAIIAPYTRVRVNVLDYRLSHRYYGGSCPADSLSLQDGGTDTRGSSWQLCGEGKLLSFNSTEKRVGVTLQAAPGRADRFNRGFLLCWQAIDPPAVGGATTPQSGHAQAPSDGIPRPTHSLIFPGLPAPAPRAPVTFAPLPTPAHPSRRGRPTTSTQKPWSAAGEATDVQHKPVSQTPGKAGDITPKTRNEVHISGGSTRRAGTTPHVLVVPVGGQNPDYLPQDADDKGWVTAVSVVVLAVVLGILLVLVLVFLRRQGCEPLCDLCGCSRRKQEGIHNPNYDNTVLTLAPSASRVPASPVVWTTTETTPVYQDPTSVTQPKVKGKVKAKVKAKVAPSAPPAGTSGQVDGSPVYAVVNKAAKKPRRLYPNLPAEEELDHTSV